MVFLYIQFKKQEYFSKDTYRLLFSKERHQKACSVDSSLINFDSKQENPELMKNFALGKVDNYKGSVHIFIFTNASTIDNKTSAAFCIPEFNILQC